MNVVFLDIDGVLNKQLAGRDIKSQYGFDDQCIENLNKILAAIPNTKVVISSSWRLVSIMESVDASKPWRDVLGNLIGHNNIYGQIGWKNEYPNIDKLGEDCDVNSANGRGRGDDIAEWLENNRKDLEIERFVILDDNQSCGNIPKMFPNNFVDCSRYEPFEALSERMAKEAIWILTNYGQDRPMTSNTWFISDTHFYHDNIIKYCNRPFANIDEMNEALIQRWNSVVGKDDVIWHLGDFVLGKKDNISIIKRLNGKINLVLGNHDHQKFKFYYEAGFNRVYDRPVIINNFYILSHAPLEWVQNPMFNIFGHVHGNPIYKTWSSNGCCVCAERHDYTPISWKTIQDHISSMKNNLTNGL